MPRKTGIDAAWEILFERHAIPDRVAEQGTFSISSAEINTVKEARLMAKFDRSAQLPTVFRQHGLSILPVSRGEYLIGPFQTHREVVYSDVRPRVVPAPALQTLDGTDLYSEASALLFCYNSGIFNDLLGSDRVAFTVNGRMSSGAFDFTIHGSREPGRRFPVSVQNAQVEIDGGYESPDAFCICEAKNMASEELLIRQLYYPYRLWRSKIAKPVVPLFLVCSNDVFHAFRYCFADEGDYNSLTLEGHSAYTFAPQSIGLDDVAALWQATRPGTEPPDVPFPQANSFARVVDLLTVLYARELTRDEVTLKYEFDVRQTDYYISACQYLGLVERFHAGETYGFRLTAEARRILSLGWREKYLALMACVIRRPVFHRALGLALRHGALPNPNVTIRLMLESGLSLNETTIARRSSTVRGWIGWILTQCGEGEQLTME